MFNQIKKHRVLKLIFCTLFTLISILIYASPVYAADNSIYSIEMTIHINSDGSADFEETWSTYNSANTELYKVWDNMNEATITDLKVTSDGTTFTDIGDWDIYASFEEKAYNSGMVVDGDDYELCFGISDYGSKTYTMTYTIENYVMQYNDTQGANYQLISSDMSPMPEDFEITITSDITLDNDTCDIYAFGYEGENVFSDNSIHLYNSGDINYVNSLIIFDDNYFTTTNTINDSSEDVVSDAKVDSSYASSTDSSSSSIGSSFFQAFSHSILFPVLSVIAYIYVLSGLKTRASSSRVFTRAKFKNGNNKINQKDVNLFRNIPFDGDLNYFYYVAARAGLITEKDKGNIISAYILKWISEDNARFIDEEKRSFFNKRKGTIDLTNSFEFDNISEKELYDILIEAADGNKMLEHNEFEKWAKKNYEKIDDWFDSVIRFGDKLATATGKLEYVETKALIFKNKKKLYTEEFRTDINYVIGLKKFLKDNSLIAEKEVLQVHLWEEYLIFASILGIADEVEKQIGTFCPEFVQTSNINTNYSTYIITNYAIRSLIASNIRSNSLPHSTSFGGGGHSSFGGGGGGFGGGGGGGAR